MDHARAASLHAARVRTHVDARKARAHAHRAEYHAGFGGIAAHVNALPYPLKWEILMRSGCANAIAASEGKPLEVRKGLYDTQMTAEVEPSRLFVPARCRLSPGDEALYPTFTARCSRFYQNCAARAGKTFSDPLVGSLDNASIRGVMTQHKDAICAGTFYPPIGEWDVSGVDDMSELFRDWGAFNRPIGDWDTSNVTTVRGMFLAAWAFNQPIGAWKVGRVADMSLMLDDATAFNQPLGTWDTSRVTSMRGMFRRAEAFNQPIGMWDTGRVTDMEQMLYKAAVFDQNISGWATGRVADMRGMFQGAHMYDNGGGPLAFDTASVRNMDDMFHDARSFRQKASFSSMQRVETLYDMFTGCHAGGGCVTSLVNPRAMGLDDQRGRIQAGPVTRKRARGAASGLLLP